MDTGATGRCRASDCRVRRVEPCPLIEQMRSRGSIGNLSLKQFISIVGSVGVIYYVSANHAALKAWFAAGEKPKRATVPAAEHRPIE